ncbi:hypothetical protein [Thermoflavimicrobium daqui]|jgi:hypothetical protein|uniref:Uncharacterized protein n=1 Tax=Thermoflavimicrobium daqui TaxID=2137476 RepID=A0A364K5H5_9BACL|nr:hypothetical protein [Thermoflavimicrobium daqui]RAL24587.1 hypothetical protein DL897_09785 [Thermoflavimicrobium daqui]
MFRIYAFLIAIVILGVQYFLSRRDNAYWGAILPILYLMTMGYLWFFGTLSGSTIDLVIAIFAGLIALLGAWASGRESMKKKRKRELEKMKSYDIQ